MFRSFKFVASNYFKLAFMASFTYQYHCIAPYIQFISHTEIQALKLKYENLHILDRSATEHLISVLRNKNTQIDVYRQFSDRLIRLLLEKAIVEHEKKITRQESSQAQYDAVEIAFEHDQFCVVTMLKSGMAYLPEAIKLLPGASIGSLLVNYDTEKKEAQIVYHKLPSNISEKKVIIVDSIITTGLRIQEALNLLISRGVKEENITIVNIVSSEKGLYHLMGKYNKVKLITGTVDTTLSTDKLAPGIGEFSDRYFGTN